jgi:hypothetical protein
MFGTSTDLKLKPSFGGIEGLPTAYWRLASPNSNEADAPDILTALNGHD